GRGSIEVIPVENQHILAFVREYEDKRILIFANLSRFSQSAFLPPSELYCGRIPVEMFSQQPFPAIGDTPYHIQIGPHGFYWFVLGLEAVAPSPRISIGQLSRERMEEELPVLTVMEGIQNLLVKTLVRDRGMENLEQLLPAFVRSQRWYGAKDQKIQNVSVR